MKVAVKAANLKNCKKHIGILCPFIVHKYTKNDIIAIHCGEPI